jgi:uncharacterized protein (TIGR01319 family)
MTEVRGYTDPATAADRDLVVCGDVGSTYTKVTVVDTATGELVATADHPTTVESDVLEGLDVVLGAVADRYPRADLSRIRLCSSAGGGLRLAVVGYEELVTAEAGHRVGLSAGAKVVHVAAGRLDPAATASLLAVRPDIVLLVGGTDGGDEVVLRHNAAQLATSRLVAPVVVAGNTDARAEVTGSLRSHGKTALPTDNVLPRIGELHPQPARATIREVFLRHVIGGKRLSRDPRFAHLVRGATPDLVLTAVELLADGLPPDAAESSDPGAARPGVVVVDVGGATTDVYSVLAPDRRHPAPETDVAGTLWRSRTVEGDLGVRWNAPGVLAAARSEDLLAPGEEPALHQAAALRAARPDLVDTRDPAVDRRLAELAITIALRRHARGERIGPATAARKGGKDLRAVRVVIGSGGVLRHSDTSAANALLSTALNDHAGGWPLPRRARHLIDHSYVLAAAGLLAEDHPDAATRLIHTRLPGVAAPARPW